MDSQGLETEKVISDKVEQIISRVREKATNIKIPLEDKPSLYKQSSTTWRKFEACVKAKEWSGALYCLHVYTKLCLDYHLHRKPKNISPASESSIENLVKTCYERLKTVEDWIKVCQNNIYAEVGSCSILNSLIQPQVKSATLKASPRGKVEQLEGRKKKENGTLTSESGQSESEKDSLKRIVVQNEKTPIKSFQQVTEQKFAEGEHIIHTRKSDNLERFGVVVKVHTEDAVNGLFYTIKTNDGHEIQTTADHLSRGV